MDGAPQPIVLTAGARDLRTVLRALSPGIVEAWGLGHYALPDAVEAMLGTGPGVPEAPADPTVTVEFQLTWPVLRVRIDSAKVRRIEYFDLAGWLFAEV